MIIANISFLVIIFSKNKKNEELFFKIGYVALVIGVIVLIVAVLLIIAGKFV